MWRLFFDQLSTAEISEEAFRFIGLKKMSLKIKLLLKIMELQDLAKKVGNSYRLTRKGIKEVYKAIINYIIEFPAKATEIFTQISKSKNYPEVVKME